MTASMHFRMPPAWFFKFPPDDEPLTLPPPTDARTFASPFAIPPHIYNGALDYKVPITVAALYATTVILWNQVNRRRGFKPYAFSQTAAFKTFVIAHNVFLAVFSAFTFFGMLRALAHTWPGREHHLFGKFWPGLRTSNGLAGAADALCKMHGPRGFGDFVTYNRASSTWVATDGSITRLGTTGLPDDSDVGRLWNEGLAFWGWWFYLSKFYEVFDTFIILAKGKRSSTLQTYHHTGAMMCMWAGIRYMSPPIWMFCFLNSGIHTMMYIYYTLSALAIKVPQRIKRTLTTCQILQFLIGITFAGMHLFVTYDIPLTKSAAVSKTLQAMASSVVSGVSSAAASATNAGIAAWLKQAALRAAGEEGLAENVLRQPLQSAPAVSSSASESRNTFAGWETVSCIDTSGQAFAIWLNLLYLAPLTGLFVRFFVKSYTRRGAAFRDQPHKGRALKAIKDAAKGTDREIDSLGKSVEDRVNDVARDVDGESNGKPTNGKSNGTAGSNGTPRSQRKVSDSINKQWERFEKGAEDASDAVKTAGKTLRKKASDGHNKLRSMFEEGSVSDRSKSPSVERGRAESDASSTLQEYASSVVDKLEETAGSAVENVKNSVSTPSSSDAQGIKEEEEQQPQQDEQNQDRKEDMEQSWADVAKDAYPKQQFKQEHDNEQASTGTERVEEEEEEDRSATPVSSLHPSRSLSPQKSKLPRPKSREPQPRSRSPVKKAPKSSSIPRPSNGTKQSQPQPSSSQTSSSISSRSSSSSKGQGVGEVAKSSLPLSPSAPNTSEPEEVEDDTGRRQQQQSKTNKGEQQDHAQSSSSTEEELGPPGEDGDKDRLRWRHASGEELGGGEAERREGVSFAEAAADGQNDRDGESGEKDDEGDISLD